MRTDYRLLTTDYETTTVLFPSPYIDKARAIARASSSKRKSPTPQSRTTLSIYAVAIHSEYAYRIPPSFPFVKGKFRENEIV